jgi:hypothetical protein
MLTPLSPTLSPKGEGVSSLHENLNTLSDLSRCGDPKVYCLQLSGAAAAPSLCEYSIF